MPDPALLGPWVRRFLLEHLRGERNLDLYNSREAATHISTAT
jgi:hypothetical protein